MKRKYQDNEDAIQSQLLIICLPYEIKQIIGRYGVFSIST